MLKEGLQHRHLDVETAFLNGELQEKVYFRLPKSLSRKYRRKMRRLHKVIYGLNQAHNRWHYKFTTDILNLDFVELKKAKCVYARVLIGLVVYILLYVDDMIVAAKTLAQIEMVIEMLSDLYLICDLGELS